MNKLLTFIVFLIISMGVYSAFIYEPCKEPSPLEKEEAFLICALNLNSNDLSLINDKACKEVGKPSNCTLEESDEPAIEKVIDEYLTDCANIALKKQNFCIDKVQNLKDL